MNYKIIETWNATHINNMAILNTYLENEWGEIVAWFMECKYNPLQYIPSEYYDSYYTLDGFTTFCHELICGLENERPLYFYMKNGNPQISFEKYEEEGIYHLLDIYEFIEFVDHMHMKDLYTNVIHDIVTNGIDGTTLYENYPDFKPYMKRDPWFVYRLQLYMNKANKRIRIHTNML